MHKLQKTLYRSKRIIKKCLSTLENPVVTITEGRVKGAVQNLLDGSPYYSFKGIRYAQAPINNLRFKAPLPPKSFDGVFNATEHGPVCPQVDIATMELREGDEDCLRLNIYTKSLSSASKLPVMFYIHGGGYMSGSGDADLFGPEFLLQHDVILVTINYRLEVLGFLSLGRPEVPGNAGMKDQTAALKWVKNNIANFGGDPDNVTIFGESAGSASVTYHMLSPLSRGLFHKAIAQSGVCIQDWAIARDAKERAFRVAINLGKETVNVEELLEFLQSVPAVNLTRMSFTTRSEDEKHRGIPTYFVPVTEKQFNVSDQFLTEDPMKMLLENKVASVPLMIGYTSSEGMMLYGNIKKKADFYNKHSSYLLPRDIAEKVSQDELKVLGERVKKFYFGGDITPQDIAPIIDFTTDTTFLYNIYRFLDIYRNSNESIYLYRFDLNTDLNVMKNTLNLSKYQGTCHMDDVFYLFHNAFNHDVYSGSEKVQKIVYDVTKLWTNFAKTGKPTADASKWPAYTRSGREYLNINESWSPGKMADKNRVDFWNKLYSEAGLPCIV